MTAFEVHKARVHSIWSFRI